MRRSWSSAGWGGSVGDVVGRVGGVVPFILWVSAGVFLLQLLTQRWGFLEQWLALSGPRLRQGWVWQPVTYLFLHGGIWHILWNMLFLWFFGREVEHYLGPGPFARLYFLSGAVGGLLWLAVNFAGGGYLLGASAAVLGCVVAFATLFPDREITLLVFFVLPVTFRAKYIALIAVGIDAAYLLASNDGKVARLAHLGGAAVGYLFIKFLGYGRVPRWIAALQAISAGLRRPGRLRRARPVARDEFLRDKIDPILDKIAREGMQSLTPAERATLDAAREIMNRPSR